MSVRSNLPMRLLRYIANHPNQRVDYAFVDPSPKDATAKRQAEIDLQQAVHHLIDTGLITGSKTDAVRYSGEITYAGLDRLDANRQWWQNFIAVSTKEAIVAATGAVIGAVATFLLLQLG